MGVMEAAYDPKAVETRWYRIWEEAGAFRPELNPDGEPFCIVIPPPNVTGSLHLGHALNLSIQDVIIRRMRMKGRAALWVPGTDHAGIATQNVVERELAAEGLSRHDLGREAFVDQVWQWKERSGGRITQQMRTLGFSCDWARERFTMDDGLSRAVVRVFVRLYEDGLIYRGERIINWCPRCQTAISDIEVDHTETMGELVTIRYPWVDGEGGIDVSTTRAETMLGDTAVAVHPDDARYTPYVGRVVRLPLLGREIPVVADEGVDPEFGTGAVKVTPAHDPLDFEIAERHELEAIKVIDEQGVITPAGGPFAGLDRFAARDAVKEALAAEGVLVGTEEHGHAVGRCQRCDTIVEPMLSLQWFVSVKPLVTPAVAAVETGETRFVPSRWAKSYLHWMANLRDWCISRQLWWGHRIPAWYCDECGEVIVAEEAPVACVRCGHEPLRPEEDVLDTWFSSALWPFSTLGWPEETEDLRRYYPNDVLVTGFDIIYFWVARMMKMGIRFLAEPPFPDIVIHGLVRAADGRKMSKSLNNVVDPLALVDRFGADPLRLALLQAAAPGHDIPLQEEWIDAARRFGNKLWNAVRFALQFLAVGDVPPEGGYPDEPGAESAWILHRWHEVAAAVDDMLDEYRFNEAFTQLYSFAWSEMFDWYLELAKAPLWDEARSEPARQTLGVVLRDLLKYLHPAIPFLTEELWSHLVGNGLVATSRWPDPPDTKAPPSMKTFQEVITRLRRFRADHGLAPRHPMRALLIDPTDHAEAWWPEQAQSVAAITLEVGSAPRQTAGHTRLVIGPVEVFIRLEGLVDVAAEQERLAGAIAAAEQDLARSQSKLDNSAFRAKAPPEVVAREEHKRDDIAGRLAKLRAQQRELG